MVNRKHLSQNVAFGLFRLLSLSVVGILFAILGFIIAEFNLQMQLNSG